MKVKQCIWGCLCLGVLAACAWADTYPRQTGVDAVHYQFRLTLGDETNEISGEAIVELRILEAGLREFALDLTSFDAAAGKGMIVTAVLAGEATLKFRHEADRLRIPLDPPAKAGERRQFTVRYHGVPGDGLRILNNKFGDRCFFSENWPNNARQWLPMIDHPYDKATSEFLVTAPVKYQVIANGLLQEETDLGDGRRLTHWKQSVPIASWLNAVGAAQFAVHYAGQVKGVELQTWVYRQERAIGPAWFEPTARQALEFFSEWIGPYSYEKLANVEAAGFGGGTEHASAIFYGENSILARPGTELITHEIAHQWFGNAITEKDWDDAWLSEGFATYFTLLFIEHSQGRDAFVEGLRRSRATVFTQQSQHPDWTVRHDNLADMKNVLSPLIYQKGAWTLHMLRGMIGTEPFWAGIREYYQRHRDGNVSTDEFRDVMEKKAGVDLAWFFRQWLTRAGSPVVEGGWRYDAATQRVVIDLRQTQPGDPYRLPLEIGLAFEGSTRPRIEKITMTGAEQRFEIASDKAPTAVALDPNTWTLMESRFDKR